MALTGFRRVCRKRSGGIRTIYLIDVRDIVSVDYDVVHDNYRAMAIKGGALALYQPNEGEAMYSEIVSTEGGLKKVSHKLLFTLSVMGETSRCVVEELAEKASGGVVALIETSEGERFLVGYSPRFATERALRLISGNGTSGSGPQDETIEQIVLGGEDTEKARLFVGTIPI